MSLFGLGAVSAAGLLGSGIALIGAGIAVDRLGARRAMLIGSVIATAGLVAAAFAPSAGTLFAALFVFGLGSAVVPVAGAGALFGAYPAAAARLGPRRAPDGSPARRDDRGCHLPGALRARRPRSSTMLGSAAAVAGTGVAFALVAGDDRRPASSRDRQALPHDPRRSRPAASCWPWPPATSSSCRRCSTYIVPAVRAAGHSRADGRRRLLRDQRRGDGGPHRLGEDRRP